MFTRVIDSQPEMLDMPVRRAARRRTCSWIYFGLATFRKGHYWMFWIGFFLPILWIIGALIAPTPTAAARA